MTSLLMNDDQIKYDELMTNGFMVEATMAAYAAGLAKVFPDHEIEAAILWTHTATLMPIPPKLVAEALNRVTAP